MSLNDIPTVHNLVFEQFGSNVVALLAVLVSIILGVPALFFGIRNEIRAKEADARADADALKNEIRANKADARADDDALKNEIRAKEANARADADARQIARRFREVEDRERRFHQENRERELTLRTASVYMQLEVNSSQIFMFTAENTALMADFRTFDPPDYAWESRRYITQREATLNLFYQTLNLFEVCARMRAEKLFPPEVFASWVIWFVEVLDSWYFRLEWPNIRRNYTPNVRAIFDVGCDLYRLYPRQDEDEDIRVAAFYQAVAHIMHDENLVPCRAILHWPTLMKTEHMTWEMLEKRWMEWTGSPLGGTNRQGRLMPSPPLPVA